MKKLRNTLIVILSALSILLSFTSVSAESTEYYLKDLGMSLYLSDTLTVKTSALPKGYYLKATNKDDTLRISIAMEKNEATEKVDSLANQSYAYLDNYKHNLQNEGLNEIKDATYGSVPFLDYKQTSKTSAGTEAFGLYSITCINGMTISIVSESIGDNFTSDELALIKSALESIRFDSIQVQQQEVAKNNTKAWILGILLTVVTAGITVAVIFVLKKNKKKRAFLASQQKNKNYDVLRSAEAEAKKSEQKNLGGYKTSSDFFDEHFDSAPVKSDPKPASSDNDVKTNKKATPLTRMGYFAKNLSREVNKAKNKKNKKSGSKKKRRAEDFDIFSSK